MVAALTFYGSYSQYICLPAEAVVVVPEGVDPVEASCLPLNYVAAYQLLHRTAKVRPGERILVYGAAGGVGTALLQLGRLAGLQVYGTASPSKQELIAQLGATPLDYKREDVVARARALTDGGADAVAGGGARNIPLIVGACRDEVQLWEVMQGAQFAPADESTLLAEMTRCVGAGIASALLHAYRIRELEASLARLRTRFLSDWIYRIPAVQCAEAQIASGGQT